MLTPDKATFLKTALPDVIFDGWTDALMARTAEKLKWNSKKLKTAFPRGAEDLAITLSLWASDASVKAMQRADLENMRVRDKVTLGVRARIEALTPHKEAFSSSIAMLKFRAPKLVWQAADTIWWEAGDKATDYNHYSKRLLLSGVITATTLFWLNTDDAEETWRFLDRRIENVLEIGKKIASFKGKVK